MRLLASDATLFPAEGTLPARCIQGARQPPHPQPGCTLRFLSLRSHGVNGCCGAGVFTTVECVIEHQTGSHSLKHSVAAGCVTGAAIAAKQGPQVRWTACTCMLLQVAPRGRARCSAAWLRACGTNSPTPDTAVSLTTRHLCAPTPYTPRFNFALQAMCLGCVGFGIFSAVIDKVFDA